METTSSTSKRLSMLTQVAGSNGTEWMVSNYNAWQKRSPLPSLPKKSSSIYFRVSGWITNESRRVNNAMAYSFRSVL